MKYVLLIGLMLAATSAALALDCSTEQLSPETDDVYGISIDPVTPGLDETTATINSFNRLTAMMPIQVGGPYTVSPGFSDEGAVTQYVSPNFDLKKVGTSDTIYHIKAGLNDGSTLDRDVTCQ